MDKFSDNLSGNITYSFYFTPTAALCRQGTDLTRYLKNRIPMQFDSYLFYDDPQAEQDPVFRDLATSEHFLHANGLPFPCVRVLLRDEALSHDRIHITDSSILLTYYQGVDIMQLAFNLSFRDADTSTLIFMHHMSGNGVPFHDGRGGEISMKDLLSALLNRLGISCSRYDMTNTYQIELNVAYGYDDLDLLAQEQPRRLYGILSGDEGWQHVPLELAVSRTRNMWSSRDFVRLIIFGPNSIILNLNQGRRFEDYIAGQTAFGTNFYGGLNPYFSMRATVAGVNHGIFFAWETSMVVKAIADRTMSHHEEYQRSCGTGGFSQSIHMTKSYRRELISTLNRVESIEMTELGELEMIILESQRITPIIDKVKYLLELLESELDLLYQNRTNTMVTILTIAGLLISVVGVVYAHLQTFGF